MTVTVQTYLEDTIDGRIIPMLKEVSAVFTPRVQQVYRVVDTNAKPPFWWAWPGSVSRREDAAQTRVFTHTVNLRLVLGYAGQTGYNGQYEGMLWTVMPTVMNYFEARRSLVYLPEQQPPKADGWLLDTENVEVLDMTPLGVFEDFGHIGIELPLVLPFRNIRFAVYGGN